MAGVDNLSIELGNCKCEGLFLRNILYNNHKFASIYYLLFTLLYHLLKFFGTNVNSKINNTMLTT